MGKCHRYSEEEIQFLENAVAGRTGAEAKRLFKDRFGIDLTDGQFEYLKYYYKLYRDPAMSAPVKGVERIKKNISLLNLSWQEKIMPVGSEVARNGIIFVKTAEPKEWKQKHIIVWEEKNGKVPKGHIIMFLDGEKSNFDIGNLISVPIGKYLFMCRKKLIFSDAELMKYGLEIADLILLINKRKREAKERKC